MSNAIREISILEKSISQERCLRGAVLDHFSLNEKYRLDVDGDGISDKVTHGEIVSSIFRAKCNAEIIDFNVSTPSRGEISLESLIHNLEQIKKSNIHGATFHAINISLSSVGPDNTISGHITVQELKKITNLNLTLENLSDTKRDK